MALDVSIYRLRTKSGYFATVQGGQSISSGASPFTAAAAAPASGGAVTTTGDQRVAGQKYWDASSFFTYDVSIGQDLFVGGSQYITGDQIITGDYKVLGDATFQQDVSIIGDLYLGGVNVWDYELIQDGSVYANLVKNISQDASIVNLGNTNISQDASIVALRNWDIAQDVSINWLNINKLGIDASLSRLSDVSLGGIGSPQDGSALVYDASGAYWKYGVAGGGSGPGGDASLGGLTDVSLGGLTNFDAIVYNSSSTDWENVTTLEAANILQSKATNTSPASSSSGTIGDMAFDASYFYICTSSNIWGRLLLENGY